MTAQQPHCRLSVRLLGGAVRFGVASAGLASGLVMVLASTGTSEARSDRFCSQTAQALFAACQAEKLDDSFVKKAICINIANEEERDECFDELKAERKESAGLCREQRKGRLDACKSLGEDRYDPDFDPVLFDDPKNPMNPNPYFPLAVGNSWEYRGGDEVNVLEVLDETKLIDGVMCIVERDQVFKGGELVEDTDDWYAHAKDGDTWYCGGTPVQA